MPAVRTTADQGRPSSILAENVRCYRILRGMTQSELAARMTVLGHGWSRSMVSGIEGNKRSVTIDELFGLAINFGVTIGRLLDPSGPDGSREIGLDLGLGPSGHSSPLPTHLARLVAESRAVVRLVEDGTGMIGIDMVSEDEPASADGLDEMGTGLGAPVWKRLSPHPQA